MPLTIRDLLLDARRGGFVLRTPYRRHERSLAGTRDLALRVASWLAREGFAPGDRALLWGTSGPDWAAAFLGCALRGVVVVPLEDAAGAPFAARVQAEAGARVAFASRASERAARESLGGIRVLLLEDLESTLRDFSPADAAELPALGDDALLEIVFTSGTTSEPKGVLLTHGNVLSILRTLQRPYEKWNARLGWLVRERPVLTLLPLSHVFGQVVGLFVPLMMNLVSVFLAHPGPASIEQALREERAWVALSVPRFLGSLRRHLAASGSFPEAGAAGLALLRARFALRRRLGFRFCCFVVGGAALDPADEEAWRHAGILLSQGYGLTETAPIVTLSSPFAQARGRVGKALRGQEIRLSGDGEILVRGANVTSGYLSKGEIHAVVDEEGWFHTGDLGEIDERGRLRIVGRSKDVIVGPEGLNVHAHDVELVLHRDARVKDAAVVGLPREGGEEVHAVLLLVEGADATDVVARANASLPPFQRLRSFTEWEGADFPRTSSTGKVRKRDLIAAIQGLGAREAEDPVARALRSLRGDGAAEARSLAELGLSSLETVELVSRLEGEYQVVLDETKLRPDMTLAELTALVREPPGSGPAHAIRMPRWARAWWARAGGALLRATLAAPALAFSARPFTVQGREHAEAVDGPMLLVGNHSSYLDAPAIFRALPAGRKHRLACAMATEPFHPLFTGGGTLAQRAVQRARYLAVVLAFGAFPLPRAGGFRGSLQYAGELVDRGWSVLVFPEGRMTLDGELQPFRPGAGLLARELGVPVLPFRIVGLWDVLPPQRGWRPSPGPVELRFGPALRLPAGASAEDWTRAMEDAVRRLAD